MCLQFVHIDAHIITPSFPWLNGAPIYMLDNVSKADTSRRFYTGMFSFLLGSTPWGGIFGLQGLLFHLLQDPHCFPKATPFLPAGGCSVHSAFLSHFHKLICSKYQEGRGSVKGQRCGGQRGQEWFPRAPVLLAPCHMASVKSPPLSSPRCLFYKMMVLAQGLSPDNLEHEICGDV